MGLGLEFECIVRTAKDKEGNILWRAIYVDNKKRLENYNLDLNETLVKYAPTNKWKEDIIVEDDIYSYLENYFPDICDFLHLLDYSEIYSNKKIYLFDKTGVVNNTWKDVRVDGKYDMYHWEEIGDKWYSAKYSQVFKSHDITKFTLEDSDEVYVWEDYDYQQSFLYLKNEDCGNNCK